MTYMKDRPFIQNIIFWLFFSSIFFSYRFVGNVYYVFYFIIAIFLIYNIISSAKNKNIIVYNKSIFIIYLYFLIFTIIISALHYKEVGSTYMIKILNVYLITVFLFFKLKHYGTKYILNFYKCFAYILNIFALVNLVEIFTKKSLFYAFVKTDAGQWQVNYFGTTDFRTFSIFINAIPYGLFLVALFWCNKYIIKNKIIYYILQINVLFNLFSTKSRSAWIAFLIILILYYIKYFIHNFKYYKFKITYKKVYIFVFSIVILTVVIYLFQNNITDIYNSISDRFVTTTSDAYGDGSRIQRLGTITAVNDYMLNNGIGNFLFGNGFHTVTQFMQNTIIMALNWSTTDNQYVSFFYEFGFIGLSLYILGLIASVVIFIRSDLSNINVLPILCFWTVSICMFFFESLGWFNIFVFLIIIMSFMCVKDNKHETLIEGQE